MEKNEFYLLMAHLNMALSMLSTTTVPAVVFLVLGFGWLVASAYSSSKTLIRLRKPRRDL